MIRFSILPRGGEPLGIDIVEPPVLFALQAKGITVVDGQQIFLAARRIKTKDEITLLTTHLEIETYTWDVLPEHLKTGDITEYVVRELEYVRDELARQVAALNK